MSDNIYIKEILNRVVSTFYSDECVVIMRFLLDSIGYKITGEDISKKLELDKKIVQKSLKQLAEHHLLSKVTIKDDGEYWYTDQKQALDVIKYRIHLLVESFRPNTTGPQIRYICNGCNEKFTGDAKDMNRIVRPNSPELRCNVCDTIVDRYVKETDPLQEKIEEQQESVRKIQNLLKKIKEIIVRDPESYVLKNSTNPKSGGTQTAPNRSSSIDEEQNTIISVVLDNVPGYNHIPGVTQIVADEEKVKKIVNTETPPWILNGKQKAAALSRGPEEKKEEKLDYNEVKANNAKALVNYLSAYYEFLSREQMFFLLSEEKEENDGALDEEMEDLVDIDEEMGEVEPTCLCGGTLVSIYEINEEHEKKMTKEEYLAYFAAASNLLPHPL